MKKPKNSEKLLLMEIFKSAKKAYGIQHSISIGQLISLIRLQLKMSQRILAKRAKIPQSTISRIESKQFDPNIFTLRKIFEALSCKLVITAFSYVDLETILRKQAHKKAEKEIRYLEGTMALEKQQPNQKLLNELLKEKEKKLLDSDGRKLWEE